MLKTVTRVPPYVVVESAAALRHAEAQLDLPVHWVTMSPYVTEILRERGEPVAVLDNLITAQIANSVGYAALEAARRAANVIDTHTNWPLQVKPGAMLVRSLHRAITAFLYKATLTDRLRQEIGADAPLITVGNSVPSPVTGFEVQCGRFDTLLATFAELVGGSVMRFDAPKPAGSGSNGDFMRPSPWTRFVTVMNAPVASTSYRLLRRLASERPRRAWVGTAGMTAAVFSANELVEETVMALARRGAQLVWLPSFPRETARTQPIRGAETLEERLRNEILETVHQHGRGGEAADHVGALIATRTLEALTRVEDLVRQAERWSESIIATAGTARLAVLSNAVSAPVDHMAVQRLKARGAPFYVFEHGVGAGLDENHEAVYRAGLAPWVDRAVYYAPHQRAAAENADEKSAPSSIVAGAPGITRRVGFAPLQRWAVRRKLGFARRERVLVWATGLYPNNMPFLPHYYRDASYHALRRQIVYDVLGRLKDRVLLKLYPTFRFNDPDPFAGLMRLPANCRSEHLIDLRNLRAAADVIMVDAPGSTLVWCWGAGVPIIYLDTEMRLKPTITREFARALFYFDTAQEGWAQSLAELLALPHHELLERWERMAAERQALGARMIVGPPGKPGSIAADYIIENVRSPDRHAVGRDLPKAAA